MSIRLSSKEQEELVLKNQRLVHYLVKKLGITPNDYDDIVSIGTIGLIKAATSFDTSKNIKFTTYASHCINNEIFMYFRKVKSHINDISLDAPISNDEKGNDITLSDIIPITDEDFTEKIAESEIFIQFISIILNLLKPKERLLLLHEIAGTNQRSIAKILNFSQSYISRLEKKLNKQVKSHLTNNKQFKGVFSMAIIGDAYQISFMSKDIRQFNKIFSTLLKNITSVDDLPNFNVNCNKERIIIRIPAHPESFSFIAQIIQEIDDFNITFVSDKSTLSTDHSVSQNVEISVDNEVKDNQTITKVQEIKENQTKQIRDYMLSMISFTVKDLKKHFPDMTTTTINNVVYLSKKKGLITSTRRGEYIVNKT